MKSFGQLIAIFLSGIIIFSSCKKDGFITSENARLAFSADSLKFDTVFTTTGSVTKSFKILNDNDQKIKLSAVKLMGGASSAFKMNVNGVPANELSNVEIASGDSIYVFVTVTVNPSSANLPFIISDSISINYNGRTRFVQLEAFGKNAVFIRNGLITGSATFTNTLPYVILGGLQVANTGALTLNAGTGIYCHADAPIIVDGSLLSNGTKALPVIFSGDRLDAPYSSFPASWPGIFFRAGSKDNVLSFTNIKNAYQAVSISQPSVNANPKLLMRQCIIDNAYDAGLLCSNTSVTAENCLISNCGRNISLSFGGNYSFTHCTVASYSNVYLLHQSPALYISNANDLDLTNPLAALLRNCIVYGDAGFVANEIDVKKLGNTPFSVTVDHCLYRADADPANTTFITSIKNQAPLFDSIDVPRRIFDFHILKEATAPGINKGVATSLLKDLDDNNRNVGLPDIGAYEKP